MKRLALHDKHESLGAVFGERDGWQVPLHYGSAVVEHRAVRRTGGLADRSYRGKLRFAGKDRITFLQGQITNDVKQLTEGQGLYAALLTIKGKMVADLALFQEGDAILMDLEPALTEKIRVQLSRYILAADVKIEDVSEKTAHLTLQGPASADLLVKLSGESLPPLSEHSVVRRSLKGHPVMIIKTAYTGEEGYDLLMPVADASNVWNLLMEAGHGIGIRPIGFEALDTLRIEAGIPRYGVDMDENAFPVEVGLEEKAISYTKGCYTGQEPISRIKHRGQVNRHLIGFILEGSTPPQKGDIVMKDGQEVGNITSGIVSPTLEKTIALGYLRRELAEAGHAVTILHVEKPIPASVATLPFYQRKK
ncbi:MAG TPA: glycine cleavage T C-terminal barrel domain-containing protein [Nitrospiria bacterium]|jgi:glycine cleavage system T protein|nr:glycine cleavage T C-terminal barrel domain-containing protein [Nitrospiria bacterium]